MVFDEFKFIIAGTVLAIALIGSIYAMFITWQPKPKKDKKILAEKQPAMATKQRLSSCFRHIKASPHYKIGLISLSLSSLILLLFLVSYFGNEDARVKRRLVKIVSAFEKRVNSQPSEIVKNEPSEYVWGAYELPSIYHNLNTNNRTPEKPTALWYRRKIYLTSTGYDVRKTDSLVTPYIADIHFYCAAHGRDGNTKEGVESGEDSFTSSTTECISKYAFQEGHWVNKSVTCNFDDINIWATPSAQDGILYQCSAMLPQSD